MKAGRPAGTLPRYVTASTHSAGKPRSNLNSDRGLRDEGFFVLRLWQLSCTSRWGRQ
jgi:hypothetical protein